MYPEIIGERDYTLVAGIKGTPWLETAEDGRQLAWETLGGDLKVRVNGHEGHFSNDGVFYIDQLLPTEDENTYMLEILCNDQVVHTISGIEVNPHRYTDIGDFAIAINSLSIGACLSEYEGETYWIYPDRSLPGIKACPIVATEYDYVCAIAFYGGKLYYSCKEAGSSEYHMSLWRCNPDGTEAEKLGGSDEPEPSLERFVIKNDALYYLISRREGARCYRMDLNTLEVEDLDRYTELPDDVYRSLVDYVYCSDGDVYYTENYGQGWLDDTIAKETESGEIITLVQGNGSSVNIEAVIGNSLYYAGSGSIDRTYSLFRMDLDSGVIEELDNKQGAGGGWYFNW